MDLNQYLDRMSTKTIIIRILALCGKPWFWALFLEIVCGVEQSKQGGILKPSRPEAILRQEWLETVLSNQPGDYKMISKSKAALTAVYPFRNCFLFCLYKTQEDTNNIIVLKVLRGV